jgi:putative transposase
MPNYRRRYIPGATYFFTLVTAKRRPILTTELARCCLREAIAQTAAEHPFTIESGVLLPDHLHYLWTLPPGDDNYPLRLALIKRRFSIAYLTNGGTETDVSPAAQSDRRYGIWQRRYWEHVIRGQDDFNQHFDRLQPGQTWSSDVPACVEMVDL